MNMKDMWVKFVRERLNNMLSETVDIFYNDNFYTKGVLGKDGEYFTIYLGKEENKTALFTLNSVIRISEIDREISVNEIDAL